MNSMLSRVREAAHTMTMSAQPTTGRTAIIDIGSNSVRLVVYDGPRRIPFILFNEKVMAGLGDSLARTGRIEEEPMERGLRAIGRFAHLCQDMKVAHIRCVATAAVRDATNGGEFIARAAAMGLTVELLTGAQEAIGAAMGVLSGIPGADGIVGDLGGGSLELARIRGGAVEQTISLPLGVLRLPEIRAKGPGALERRVKAMMEKAGWQPEPDLPFYLVGGSWRALARFDMQLTNFPLPVVHQYEMTAARAEKLTRIVSHVSRARLKSIPAMSGSRIPTLPNAAALLSVVVRQLRSSRLVVSAYGLREGLLYEDLPEDIRAHDPLLVSAEAEGEAQSRFRGHGDRIERWIAPLFPEDGPDVRRIRRAACLLADVGWRARISAPNGAWKSRCTAIGSASWRRSGGCWRRRSTVILAAACPSRPASINSHHRKPCAMPRFGGSRSGWRSACRAVSKDHSPCRGWGVRATCSPCRCKRTTRNCLAKQSSGACGIWRRQWASNIA